MPKVGAEEAMLLVCPNCRAEARMSALVEDGKLHAECDPGDMKVSGEE